VTVAGSSKLKVVPDNLLYFLTDGTPRDTRVFLRRGMQATPGKFERLVAQWCLEYAHPEARWIIPDPEDGPGAAFIRDREMVRQSDLVLAFFAPEMLMDGGTGHIVECAIDLAVPCYSWQVTRDIVRVGEHDPDAVWQGTIREWFEVE
jgi:hypothetical protein